MLPRRRGVRARLARIDLHFRERVRLLDIASRRGVRTRIQTITSLVRALEPRPGWNRRKAENLAVELADALDLRESDRRLDTDAIFILAERLRRNAWVDHHGRIRVAFTSGSLLDMTAVLERDEEWKRRHAS